MNESTRSNVRRLCRIPRILTDESRVAGTTTLTCSFCAKDIVEARYLVSSGAARICGDCVHSFAKLLTLSIRSDRH